MHEGEIELELSGLGPGKGQTLRSVGGFVDVLHPVKCFCYRLSPGDVIAIRSYPC